MKHLSVAAVLAVSALGATLAGCGRGSTPTPLTFRPPANEPGSSWMAPDAKGGALLYVTSELALTAFIYSYPAMVLVGEIDGLPDPYTMCVDKAQDVYITQPTAQLVYEYEHASVARTRALADHDGFPSACAVDPKSGNLAIANLVGPSSGPGNVLVYSAAKGTPTKYTAPSFDEYFFATYDDGGNLFVDGEDASRNALLAELPRGKSAFKAIRMNQSFGIIGDLGWDGEFLAIADDMSNTIYQFNVSGTRAIVKDSTPLSGVTVLSQFAFSGGRSKHPQATAVAGGDQLGTSVDRWAYPVGGAPIKSVTTHEVSQGVAISL